jgi:hypothetical protein
MLVRSTLQVNPANKLQISHMGDAGFPIARYIIDRLWVRSADMPEYYEINIKGYLDQRRSEWFASLKLAHVDFSQH